MGNMHVRDKPDTSTVFIAYIHGKDLVLYTVYSTSILYITVLGKQPVALLAVNWVTVQYCTVWYCTVLIPVYCLCLLVTAWCV